MKTAGLTDAPVVAAPASPPAARLRRRPVVALLASCGAAGSVRAAAPQPRPWPRALPTPPLELPALDAPRFSLAEARGQVVVLNFWAGWCEPCRDEMPSLERLARRHAADGLVVRAVNFRESVATIRSFLQQAPATPPVLRDADGDAARAWQVRIFPTTIVVGRDGRAAFSVIGEADWSGEAALQWLAPLLAARGASSPSG